ncbi:MAG: hypothetical protein U0J92_06970 [Prevotellamassilia sp.]|nr:hypothetical protein [Prevotellamassilia sp.]
MKKNNYIKPQVKVYQIETQTILANSEIRRASETDYNEEMVNSYRDAENRIWAD